MSLDNTTVFDNSGRFRSEFTGPFTQISGHDGANTWEQNPDGNGRRLQGGDAGLVLLFNWFCTSHWLSPDSGLSLAMSPEDSSRELVGVHVDAGDGAKAVVLVDRETWLPSALKMTQYGREKTATIEWGERLDGRAMPRRIEMTDGGKIYVTWEITQRGMPGSSSPRTRARVPTCWEMGSLGRT